MLLTLLVAAGVLLVSVLLYAIAMALIVHRVVCALHRSHAASGFWRGVAVMMEVTLITAVAHWAQIALWAVVYLVCGEVATFETAFYFSAENYTALGYGDITLSERWRLLGPCEAINGLLLFGLSTSVMFAVLNRLITNRLRRLGLEG